ncbi:uncharacterized protein T05G5.1-like [Pollicipes pollicipes]|uniref:uncharacterized protein T05G5.1-like n=1 Tax=Pollicipes pollicipes TaxID=41117 RepID=UPI0018858337|nr:uncharacterized protein T05G5.1-like [Pollicipes pollicipes]
MRLQQSLMDVESRMAHEGKKHEMTRMQQNKKIIDLTSSLGECRRYGEDDVRELQRRAGGLTGATDSEKQRLQRAIDDLRGRMESRDRKRTGRRQEDGDALQQLKSLERGLEQEVAARTSREAALKDEVERRLADIKTYTDDGFGDVRKMTEAEHSQTRTRFKELTDALNLLESSREQDQAQMDQLLEKQKDARRKLDREMDDRVDDIGDRLRIAMASLQAAHE